MGGSRGFSLVEAMLALALTLVVSAAVMAIVVPAQHAAVVQPEIGDLQQRLRIASDAIHADLILAGAPAVGPIMPALGATIPALLPYRAAAVDPDPPGSFTSGTITIIRAVAGSAAATLAHVLLPGSHRVAIHAAAGCPVIGPVRDPACGFTAGTTVLIVDAAGGYGDFTVTGTAGDVLSLQPAGGGAGRQYAAGSAIVPVQRITYYLKEATNQLMRSNGGESDAPAVDHVAGLELTYFGADPAGSDKLVPLSAGDLSDGPWRPDAADPNRYDTDLLRVRRVAVHLRLAPAIRLPHLPGLTASFDVAPRNLNAAP